MTHHQGEYIIIGPPGCGKTRRVAQSVHRIVEQGRRTGDRDPVLVCSLTRTAAAEAAGRCGLRKEMVGTLHSHAYRALGHPRLIDQQVVQDFNDQHPHYRMSAPDADSRVDGEEVEQQDPDLPGDELGGRYSLLRARRQDPAAAAGAVPRFAEAWERHKRDCGVLDFSDLIDHAIHECPAAPHDPRVVIADEAQDMSAAEFALIQQWGRAAGAEILVGDPWQALYVWRGADPDYLSRRTLPEGHRDVLSQSYRVPIAVHRVATQWARGLSSWTDIAYQPTDQPGAVVRMGDATFQQPDAAVQLAEELWAGRKESVMILGACGYMLTPTIRCLRDAALPYSNPWRRRRGDWNPLTPGSGKSVGRRFCDFCEALYRWSARSAWTPEETWSWIKPLRASGLTRTGQRGKLESMSCQIDLADLEAPLDQLKPMLTDETVSALDRLAGLWRSAPRRAMPEMVRWYEQRLSGRRSGAKDFAMRVALERGPRWLMREDERPELPRIYVGSIHSFKGAEADHVILMPDLSLRGYEGMLDRPDATIRQFYVAMTRARQSLTVLEPAGEKCVDLSRFV